MYGTPKTLKEAVLFGATSAHGENAIYHLESVVKDYLSQKFTAAFIKATPEELENLKTLWFKITGEELK